MGMGQNAMYDIGSNSNRSDNSMSGIGGNMSFNLGSMNSNLPPASSTQAPARPPRPTAKMIWRSRLDLNFFGASSDGSKNTGASNTNSSDPFDMSAFSNTSSQGNTSSNAKQVGISLKGKKKKKRCETMLKTTHEPNHKKSNSDDPFAMLSNAPDTGMESNGILQIPTSQSSNNGGSTTRLSERPTGCI